MTHNDTLSRLSEWVRIATVDRREEFEKRFNHGCKCASVSFSDTEIESRFVLLSGQTIVTISPISEFLLWLEGGKNL
jgi:hypothetical protein